MLGGLSPTFYKRRGVERWSSRRRRLRSERWQEAESLDYAREIRREIHVTADVDIAHIIDGDFHHDVSELPLAVPVRTPRSDDRTRGINTNMR